MFFNSFITKDITYYFFLKIVLWANSFNLIASVMKHKVTGKRERIYVLGTKATTNNSPQAISSLKVIT